MKQLCKLQREKAINILLDAVGNEHIGYIKYRSGIWNKYETTSIKQALTYIKNSAYGADIFKDEKGAYYVSCPCGSDMW